MADDAIQRIPVIYNMVTVDGYVIMPNHIHLVLQIHPDESGRPMAAPTIPILINQYKGFVTKQAGRPLWQKSFNEHIIRNQRDYQNHMKYMYENPLRWHYDELYCEK